MSYQDKQLKKEFITVDNRTIPFGYPQFWGGDDWEVSGRDNPLPVANYTQNEQGLWVPVSNENPMPTQLTGSRVELIKEHLNSTALIGAGSVRYFADSIGGGAQTNPVDVRRYNKVIIKVRNGHDEQTVVRIFSYKELHEGSGSGVNRLFQIGSEELPAGSEKIFSSIEYSELALPHIGLSVQLTSVSSEATGTVDVIYIGGVSS